MADQPSPDIITLTAYPPGPGPYERWELTVDRTGEVLLKGDTFPIDRDAVRAACNAYHQREEAPHD